MATKIAINGFGRIGRGVLRALVENGAQDIEVVAVNDLAPPDHLAHLLKFDSVHGRLNAGIRLAGDVLEVAGQRIRLTAIRTPEDLPWQDVDVAFECTGLFTSRDKAARHLQNGSRRVLISAPGTDVDRTVVYGVNDQDLTAEDVIVSNASCTTNCLAPVAMVLDRAFGIRTGYMTTVHSYTGDQPSHDTDHKDLYRARAAALSMVPTSTGAARAISLVLPELKGRLEGSAIRVPTPNVSAVDLTFVASKDVTVEDVNEVVREAAAGPMGRVLGYDPEPKVSVDFNHTTQSSIFAPDQTKVIGGRTVRVLAWYDNEWGFSCRMADVAEAMGRLAN